MRQHLCLYGLVSLFCFPVNVWSALCSIPQSISAPKTGGRNVWECLHNHGSGLPPYLQGTPLSVLFLGTGHKRLLTFLSQEYNYFSFSLVLTIRALLTTSFGLPTASYFDTIATLARVNCKSPNSLLCKLAKVCGFYLVEALFHPVTSCSTMKNEKKADSQVRPNSPCFYPPPELSFGDAARPMWVLCTSHFWNALFFPP